MSNIYLKIEGELCIVDIKYSFKTFLFITSSIAVGALSNTATLPIQSKSCQHGYHQLERLWF